MEIYFVLHNFHNTFLLRGGIYKTKVREYSNIIKLFGRPSISRVLHSIKTRK